MSMQDIGKIAELINEHYENSHAFIVVTGLDTICHIGTTLSFMLENLAKLVRFFLFRLSVQEAIYL